MSAEAGLGASSGRLEISKCSQVVSYSLSFMDNQDDLREEA